MSLPRDRHDTESPTGDRLGMNRRDLLAIGAMDVVAGMPEWALAAPQAN